MADKVGDIEFDVTVNTEGAVSSSEKIIKANDKVEQSFEKVEQATKDTGGAYSKLAPTIDQLNSKYDKATTSLLNAVNAQLSMGNIIDKNNKVIDKNGKEVVEATAALQSYAAQANKVGTQITATNAAMGRMIKSSGAMGGAMGNAGHMAGQLGFQIQDVAVQAQMGTSAFTILAQQGSQIASVFGPQGAVVGAVIAISSALVGAFLPSLLDSGKGVEDLTKKLKDLKDEFKLTAEQQALLTQVENEDKKNKKERIAELEKEIAANEKLIKQTEQRSKGLGRMAKAAKTGGADQIEETNKKLVEQRAELSTLQQEVGDLTKVVTEEEQKKTDSVIRESQRRLQSLQNSANAETQLLKLKAENLKSIEEGSISARMAKEKEMQLSRVAAMEAGHRRLIEQLENDKQAVIDNENIKGAEQQAQIKRYDDLKLQASANHQKAIEQQAQAHSNNLVSIKEQEEAAKARFTTNIEGLKAQLDSEKEILAAHSQFKLQVKNGEITEEAAAEMAANEAANARLTEKHEKLLAQLELDKQALLANKMLTKDEMAALEMQYDELELAAQQSHDQQMLAQAQKTADNMVKIKEMEEAAKRQAVSGAFKNLSQLMNTESRKLFEIGKAAALANAIVTGYDAAVTNYNQGSKIGGPPVGAAFAAASLAATFAQIKSIQSTQFGSAGGGQSVQGGQVSTNTGVGVGPQQASRNVSISLTGDNFGSGGIRGLIDEINEAVGDGVNVFASGG